LIGGETTERPKGLREAMLQSSWEGRDGEVEGGGEGGRGRRWEKGGRGRWRSWGSLEVVVVAAAAAANRRLSSLT
jgi:hypothetical protein